ncbi:hypothetical protein F5884DRAFT_105616 [Xylogone sp. PMI_703]|nr:hypothetical protein F5884DRAFT_105616 [Xylogone sp. PMI_703]
MRCIRSESPVQGGSSALEPCERCSRSGKPCRIPQPRPLGRKRGSVGRYKGIEKAWRQIETELKKARSKSQLPLTVGSTNIIDVVSLLQSDADQSTPNGFGFESGLVSNRSLEKSCPSQNGLENGFVQNFEQHIPQESRHIGFSASTPTLPLPAHSTHPAALPTRLRTIASPQSPEIGSSRAGHSFGLLADVAGALQQLPTHRAAIEGEQRIDSDPFKLLADAAEAARQLPAHDRTPETEPSTVSNPFGLLADAAGAAQARESSYSNSKTSPLPSSESSAAQYDSPRTSESSRPGPKPNLQSLPGRVSLGLSINPERLRKGMDVLFDLEPRSNRHSDYFKPPEPHSRRDIGPDVDPVELGIVTMDKAEALFPIYFSRLHPINGILDPNLHTPTFVRARSALLFTWMLALTAQFEPNCSTLAKRLRLHGEKLSKYVHSCGYKSVDIIQGYYISLLSATPATSMYEERTWLYTMYAFGVAADLGLDQRCRDLPGRSGADTLRDPTGSPQHQSALSNRSEGHMDPDELQRRLARNRERTWLRILLWERANSAARGRMNAFPENELTQQTETWWKHPLAIQTDRHTCAFIELRRQLALMHAELRKEALKPQSDPHWVRKFINKSIASWCQTWLTEANIPDPIEFISNVFLRYVYTHGLLWTLSFALHDSNICNVDVRAMRKDCFEAAVECCEVAVRDLQDIGDPLYCMLAPTWAMLSYAAVLALKLFPSVHGNRPGSEVELLALLSQLAMELEKAGSTPSHRFGIAALLGQHLMMIVRAHSAAVKESIVNLQTRDFQQHNDLLTSTATSATFDSSDSCPMELLPYQISNDPMLGNFDPFFTAPMIEGEGVISGDYVGVFQEFFGQQGFGGIS